MAILSPDKIISAFSEIQTAPCSRGHHLNCKGGLMIHTINVSDNAKKYFPDDDTLFFLATIHDIGKARVYKFVNGIIEFIKPEADHILHTITMLAEIGITLTSEELNALQFHHGGWSNFKGEMTPLAVKLHFCDLLATVEETKNEV